jgi:hypothetical protein
MGERFEKSIPWRPCVAVDANGFVDKKQLQAVRKYWRAVAQAKQKLGFAQEEM